MHIPRGGKAEAGASDYGLREGGRRTAETIRPPRAELATAMQAGVTPAPWSVALRMALAGLILVGYARLRGVPLTIPRKDRPAVALQGLLFFAIAFIAFYEATARMPSGLAALVLSTSSLFAAVIARTTLGVPISAGFVWGALCGILGLAIIFLPGAGAHGTSTRNDASVVEAIAAHR